MSMAQQGHGVATSLPPGFRFHPTDEELILHYLRNRAAAAPCPVPIIADVDIYKFDPWDLPSQAVYGDCEWYFFSPRDRKYPNGIRPNRAAGSGYWKATGTDKPIHDAATGQGVGVKKALVFYRGRPPKGTKTTWIMHEYRLAADPLTAAVNTYKPIKFRNVSMRLDDWVLCRIYKKTGLASPMVPPLADYDHMADGRPRRPLRRRRRLRRRHLQTHDQAAAPPAAARREAPDVPVLLRAVRRLPVRADLGHRGRARRHPPPRRPPLPEPAPPRRRQQARSGAVVLRAVVVVAGRQRRERGETQGGEPGRTRHAPAVGSAKKLNGSCFDAPPQSANGWQTVASVLGGLNHHMLPQF